MAEKVFVTGSDECTHPYSKRIKKQDLPDEIVQVRVDEGDGIQRCSSCGRVWKELD